MQKKFEVQDLSALPEILGFISQSLKELKINSKEAIRAELMCEEVLAKLIGHGEFTEKNFVCVNINKFLGELNINLQVPGPEFDFQFDGGFSFSLKDDENDEEISETIRGLILRSFNNQIKYKHKKSSNAVTITVLRSPRAALYRILATLFLAVITGLFMKNFMPENISIIINENLFVPVRSILLNGLKMFAMPIIFFSLISCFFVDDNDISQTKRIGFKLFTIWQFMHVVAALIGIGFVLLFGIGKGANLSAHAASQTVQNINISLKDTLTRIMAGNLLRPFLEDNMLQILVIGIFIGIAANVTEAKTFKVFINELIKIFAKIVNYLLRFTPLIVFCAVASLIITTGVQTLLSVLGILLTMCAAFLILNIILCLMILFSGLNPFTFYKKSVQVIITAFSTNASDAAMPEAMKSLEGMGVPPSIYSFAISLGMAVSKMANPLYMFISILSIANMYNVEISAAKILSIFFSITFIVPLLPGIPGMTLTAMSSFFVAFGCPIEGIALIMAIDNIAGMIIRSPGNVFSVTVPALIVAKQEKLMDVEKYNS